MENDRAKQIIVRVLQNALTGQLDPSSHFNPQFVADAIADKVNFEKSYGDVKNERLIKSIMASKNDVKAELDKLSPDEKLLANFIRGKLEVYEELLSVLNK